MGFHWSLSDSKSPQVSRTRLSNAAIWIVPTRPQTSKSSRPFNNPLVIVSKAPITIGTIVTFNSLARSRYSSFFSHSFRLLLLFHSFESFSYQRSLMVSHWSLRDNKSPQVSRTLLSILADLNNTVVWLVTTCLLISKSSS